MQNSTPETRYSVEAQFRTTHWSAVFRAGQGERKEAAAALNELCQVYWYPLYAFARRQGQTPNEAEDLTQGFFAHLLNGNFLAGADQEKGRFRAFLLTAFRRFSANEWNRQHMQKRGGYRPTVPLDAAWAESRYGAEPVQGFSPDVLYERQWAETLLDEVMRRLQAEYLESGRARLFERLEACLSQDETACRYTDIALELGLTEAAVKMAMQRLRARYRALLREEIAKTVGSTDDVELELRHLFSVFRS
ncbi:MAG TPA: sigma-70 family RNA polymerase sigma factor [Candidatus Paceibacterota bacterium]|nr:sigma-70 family RNA polymerase sigma factor [Verrucomicrobiota bacterium]HRY49880.1 sigma-70 family RNA polymerase sigma factor [Candidatus Paceibacterota bacterium]HSA01236.1 sigma-70 family RNA polymerase sigma factor [Candidatus Paceibacterota bacterium]